MLLFSIGAEVIFGEVEKGFVFALVIPLVMLIVTLHELGHCYAAKKLGYHTKSITLTAIGGVALIEGIERNVKHELLIAISGPLVNVVLFVLFVATIGFPSAGDFEIFSGNLFMHVYSFGFAINIVMLFFNMIPVYPMDGGRVLKSISILIIGKKWGKRATILTSLVAGVLLISWLVYNSIWLLSAAVAVILILGIWENLLKEEPS